MSARGRARTRAVEVLFEAEQRDEPALEVMSRRRAHDDKQLGAYTEEIIRGVLLRRPEIDEAVQTWSRGWTLERMPAVDRTLLRVGAWELLYNDDVPDAVAVAEAVGFIGVSHQQPRHVMSTFCAWRWSKPNKLLY